MTEYIPLLDFRVSLQYLNHAKILKVSLKYLNHAKILEFSYNI